MQCVVFPILLSSECKALYESIYIVTHQVSMILYIMYAHYIKLKSLTPIGTMYLHDRVYVMLFMSWWIKSCKLVMQDVIIDLSLVSSRIEPWINIYTVTLG